MAKQLITVYRGCPIYYLTPPDVAKEQFQSTCVTGGFSKLSAIKKRICEATDGYWYDDECHEEPEPPPPVFTCPECGAEFATQEELDAHMEAEHPPPPVPPTPPLEYVCPVCGAEFASEAALVAHMEAEHPPTPPPDDGDYLEEVYRGVDIWWIESLDAYRAYVTPLHIANGDTLPDIRTEIDEILDSLEPPEDPPDGLFAQIIAAVKTWFNSVIGDRLRPLYDWIDDKLIDAKAAWEGLIADVSGVIAGVHASLISLSEAVTAKWDNFTTVILPDIWAVITTKIKDAVDGFNAAFLAFNAVLEQGLVDLTDYIDSRIDLWDPIGFLKDPPAYISGLFSILGLAKDTGMIESFLAGLEEGLEE